MLKTFPQKVAERATTALKPNPMWWTRVFVFNREHVTCFIMFTAFVYKQNIHVLFWFICVHFPVLFVFPSPLIKFLHTKTNWSSNFEHREASTVTAMTAIERERVPQRGILWDCHTCDHTSLCGFTLTLTQRSISVMQCSASLWRTYEHWNVQYCN